MQLCCAADGLPDEFLLAKAVEEVLTSMALKHSPPLPPNTLLASLADGTPYQQAVCALRRFMTAYNAPVAGVAGWDGVTAAPFMGPPPSCEQHAFGLASSQPGMQSNQHFAPPPHAKPSRPASNVPADAKSAAVHTALMLDRVSANQQDALAMETLSQLHRSLGPKNQQFQDALQDTTHNVKALLGLDVEHVDPGSGERVQETYLYARVLVKARGAEVRAVLEERERMLVPALVQPAPDYDKFGRFIQSGALLLITEQIVAAQNGASNKVLFAGGFTETARSKAFMRLDVVLRAFAVAHPSQKSLVSKALASLESLLRECMDARIDMKVMHDTVWVPFARATQRAYGEAREQIDAPYPDLDVAKLADHSPNVRSLFRQAALKQQAAVAPAPAPVAAPLAAPLVVTGGAALVRPPNPNGPPLVPRPPPIGPPKGATPTFNPAMPNQPGFVAKAANAPPHTAMWPHIACRGWTAGKCIYGTGCRFMHAGY